MNWLRRFREAFRRAWAYTFPNPPEVRAENRVLREILGGMSQDETSYLDRYMEMADEWVEARMMAGAGPGMTATKLREEAGNALVRIRERAVGIRPKESQPVSAQGAFGDIELALQNVEWRREINLSWLEFSRWGIQQIILISRLYYIKNPLIRAATNLASVYVFGRGVQVTTDDDDANEVLEEFFERNKETLGQDALLKSERRKYYDGNLFWVFFTDTNDTGKTSVRLMDATEVQEVVNNPDDDSDPWIYRRVWVSKQFDMVNGQIHNDSHQAWYPALGYEPAQKPEMIGGYPVNWEQPVLHRKCGDVANWHFGCPIAYPALDWAKEARRLLEACATVRRSLAQIAMKLTTKGGQAALGNAKQQLQTTVNAQPGNSLYDTNPTAVNASIFASGPGTTLEAFKTAGAGGNPDDVKWYIAFVAMCFGIPVTWLGELETANLATATTLDRPTELGFLEKQEAWVEDLTIMAKYVLEAAGKAPGGRLVESTTKILETKRVLRRDGKRVYEAIAAKKGEAHIRVIFPSIREGDLPMLVKAITQAATLDNKGGQVVGIDEKVMVRLLYEVLGSQFNIEDIEDLVESQYPDKAEGDVPAYDPARTYEPLPAPIGRAQPSPGGQPQAPGGNDPKPVDKTVEALRRLAEALGKLKGEAA